MQSGFHDWESNQQYREISPTTNGNPYREIPPRRYPNKPLPLTVRTQFIKMVEKDMRYIGEAYDVIDDKVKLFLDLCYSAEIQPSQFHAVFSHVLAGHAREYYVTKCDREFTFDVVYQRLKTNFDTDVNKKQYHTDGRRSPLQDTNAEGFGRQEAS
jgi:hypothetical protein